MRSEKWPKIWKKKPHIDVVHMKNINTAGIGKKIKTLQG